MNAAKTVLVVGVVFVGFALGTATAATPEQQAKQILETAGVQGGLIVHLGCGDGRLTAALGAEDQYLVQGLDTQPANVAAARKHIRSLGIYGRVTAGPFRGDRLPYVDNLINLLVVDDAGGISREELLRIVSPGGVVCVNNGDGWTNTAKPRPSEIDEWTHFLYDSTNNAVSQDTVVGPPRQLQWVGAPCWARSHDHLATVSAVVSSGGRIFSIIDEGPTASILLPPQWNLVAQDAFSGVVLWKREIPLWQWHLRGFRSGPSDLARRLVAADGRVYVTLDINAGVSVLDPATGKTIAEYGGTRYAREILYRDGTLYVVAGGPWAETTAARAQRRGLEEVRSQRPDYLEEPPAKRILAIDTGSGKVLWEKGDADTRELLPSTLTVAGGRVYFQNADKLFCLEADSGKPVWQADRPSSHSRYTWSAPTLVVVGDVVLSGDRAIEQKKLDTDPSREVEWLVSSRGGQAPVGKLIAYSTKDGKQLWTSTAKDCYNAPPDVLVADNLVWTGTLVRASEPGVTQGLNLETGEVARTRPPDKEFFSPGMGHHRCYRNKATEKFLLLGRSGVEFIDVKTGNAAPNHWTRGTCQYGIMPANGLLYAPPHSCACFINSKLNGYDCFAPERKSMLTETPAGERLEKGPAYNTPLSALNSQPPDDWPTYRHDASRSGKTKTEVPVKLARAWQTDLGGLLSSVAVADGRLFVAQIETHTVYALDAKSGKTLWSFTAGGRVDSPPTVWQGRVYFGSADGYVYCLAAGDGSLAWRYLAAPSDMRIVSYGQIESAWPLHGSVLVHDGVACAAAGRSSYLDGGIRLVRLDAKTGQLLSETVVDDRDPETHLQKKGSVRGTDMPGALPDVLSTDGDSLFMRHRRFSLDGAQQPPDVPHLYCAAGFLDGSWWHRTYWQFADKMGNNYGGWPTTGNRNPAGRILAVDGDTIYGFGRNQYIHHGAHVGLDGATIYHFRPDQDAQRRETYYQLFAIDKPAPPANANPGRRARPKPKQYRWAEHVPMLARAMVAAKDSLIVAGIPDFLESDDPTATLAGKSGGLLRVVDPSSGAARSQIDLASPPVWDGMAAADSHLFLATLDGKVVCYGEKQ